MVFQQNEPLPVSYLPIGHTEGAEEQRGIYHILCSSLPEVAERAQQRGFERLIYLLIYLLSFPPLSFDSQNSLNQTVPVEPSSVYGPVLFLLWLWHSQTMVLLVFKVTFLPSGTCCRAGTLPTIRPILVLRMLWGVSPGSLSCRAKGLRDILWCWSSSGAAAPQNT